MNIADLQDCPLIYVATPYSKYPRGLEMAARDAAEVMGDLVRLGLKVFSPIVHSHPICVHGDVPALDHSLWLTFDKALMDKSDALLVVHMDGWDESFGIAEETKAFKAAGKPVLHLDPVSLELIEMVAA